MILIADSGSTKTDWRLIDDNKKIYQFRTGGMNPYFMSSEGITEIIRRELLPEMNSGEIKEIYFYGAGCSSEEKCNVVANGIHALFSTAAIEIHHDMLAACRAHCGREKGIVAILGTGSNSCLYDGEKIVSQVPSLGFILGDEGSGTHIGKKLLRALFYGELSDDLVKKFEERFHLSKDDVLENVYKKPLPNQFLASFMHFVFQNRSEIIFSKMVHESFAEFFNRHICKYNDYGAYQFHCTGSVGFYFTDLLRQVAAEKGVSIGKITESPIAGLTLYHLGEL